MGSREDILSAVKESQPELLPLPDLQHFFEREDGDDLAEFTRVVEGIGAKVYRAADEEEVIRLLKAEFETDLIRIISTMPEFDEIAAPFDGSDNHGLADVELMILPAHFAVAENGACWVNDQLFKERILPFIPQHLALILKKDDIVPTMHHAYQRIGKQNYSFGAFIAGPSKTADIEQSLVLGAHGPRSLRVFFID